MQNVATNSGKHTRYLTRQDYESAFTLETNSPKIDTVILCTTSLLIKDFVPDGKMYDGVFGHLTVADGVVSLIAFCVSPFWARGAWAA